MVSTAHPSSTPSLRDRATRAVRVEVGEVATRLFLAQGFEKTTVDQIAAEAGMSRTSFFRYFPTKEDVVLGHLEELGHQVLEALMARPEDESPWQALRRSFDLLVVDSTEQPEDGLAMARLFNHTPSLKVRQLGKQLTWHDLLVPEIARRLGNSGDEFDPRPRALVAAALGCLNAASDMWMESNGAVDLTTLLGQAMDAVSR